MKDKWIHVLFRTLVCLVVCAGAILLTSGCEDDDDDYDHDPPAGMGALIVDNKTDNDMAVYIDGIEQVKTDEDHWRAYDLFPGEYRVVLREKGGDRSSSFDADILEGRQTIVDAQGSSGRNHYDIYIRYD
ncbi:MAG: hypothetical protein EOM20_14935 [Spartobacteria bacterium]|nr:hypothetical protein [Spartobacteria bacterium]